MTSTSTRRVLYVDDNPTNVMLFERILRQRPDLEFQSCPNGRSGLDSVRGGPVDLLFLDVHLPDLTGGEVLAAIRADPATADTKVVMVTADLSIREADFADDPLTSFFAKPVEVHRLIHLLDVELPSDAAD